MSSGKGESSRLPGDGMPLVQDRVLEILASIANDIREIKGLMQENIKNKGKDGQYVITEDLHEKVRELIQEELRLERQEESCARTEGKEKQLMEFSDDQADILYDASPSQRPSVQEETHDLHDDTSGITKLLDYFVVVDFKATCEKGKQIYPQEIIEFSSVLVDAKTGDPESTFHTYLRPQHHPKLTDYCREYNGIRQTDVDAGVVLAEALPMHEAWLREAETKKGKPLSFAVVTWGNWDCRTMLDRECQFKGVANLQYFHRWINLKIPFVEKFGKGHSSASVLEAVMAAGMLWEGLRKGGVYDAHNKARLLALLMRQGVKLSITSTLGTTPAPQLL